MARMGENQNTQANAIYQGEQQQAYGAAQGDIGQFGNNVYTLERGGNVAADPWKNAGYLANQNRLQSGALDSATNAGTALLRQNNARTGGMNTGATVGATKGLIQDKMRLGDELSAQRSAQDYNKNVGYQTQVAGMPLAAAGAESPYFSGAVSGQSDALKNLTQFGVASYGPWLAAIKAAGQGAASLAGSQQGGGGDDSDEEES